MANKYVKIILITIIFSFLLNPTLNAKDEKILRIGIIIDGPWQRNIEYVTMIKSEILELTGSEFDVRFPENKVIVGNWNITQIKSAVSNLLADPEVDLVLTLGVIASHEIARIEELEKPVIAPFILDPILQGVPLEEGIK